MVTSTDTKEESKNMFLCMQSRIRTWSLSSIDEKKQKMLQPKNSVNSNHRIKMPSDDDNEYGF
jgi:hypothetical protein